MCIYSRASQGNAPSSSAAATGAIAAAYTPSLSNPGYITSSAARLFAV